MIGSLMSLVSRLMLIEFSASSISWLVSFTTHLGVPHTEDDENAVKIMKYWPYEEARGENSNLYSHSMKHKR